MKYPHSFTKPPRIRKRTPTSVNVPQPTSVNATQPLHAYEFKWSTEKGASMLITFKRAYPDTPFQVIRPDNYLDFLGGV